MDKVSSTLITGQQQVNNILLDKNIMYMFIALAFVAVFFSSHIPSQITNHIDRPIVKFGVLGSIVYLSSINPSLAVLLTVSYLVTYNNCVTRETKENFSQIETFQQLERYDDDSEDSLGSQSVEDSEDTEDSGESDYTESDE